MGISYAELARMDPELSRCLLAHLITSGIDARRQTLCIVDFADNAAKQNRRSTGTRPARQEPTAPRAVTVRQRCDSVQEAF